MDQSPQQEEAVAVSLEALEKRPAIFIVGPTNVGKRTLLSRLLSVDIEDASDSSSDIQAYGWTINTKYYTAEVSIWMSHLEHEFSIETLPIYDRVAALVMVFDMNELSSFNALKKWVSKTDIQKFDILLCIGNKVDLLSGHPAHTEYRRHLLKLEESSDYSNPELSEYGISETEGNSLLGNEEPSLDIKKSCLEWCVDQNIEFVEVCASNVDFDKCLSLDGDSQGVERIFGALSAHMWPGMILKKSGDKINEPSLPEYQDSEEESDYELEYAHLSDGSAEPWDDTFGEYVTANGPTQENVEVKPSTSQIQEESVKDQEGDTTYDIENLEQLMSDIGNMRDNLRLLPDFQRREMAANLAMKMAAMFGGESEDEEGFDS